MNIHDCKKLPNNFHSERAVLRIIMTDIDKFKTVYNKLEEHDFYYTENAIIYKTIIKLYEEHSFFDIITISESLLLQKKIGTNVDLNFLHKIIKNYSSYNNVSEYIQEIKKTSILRNIIIWLKETAERGYSRIYDLNNFIYESKQIINKINSSITKLKNNPTDFYNHLNSYILHIKELSKSHNKFTGLESGFSNLDKYTLGFQKSDFVIIAGRPSMGKTTLAMNILEYNAIKNNKTVLFFSMEAKIKQLISKLLSSVYNIDLKAINSGNINSYDLNKIITNKETLGNKSIFFDDMGILKIADIKIRARQIISNNGSLDLIIIDYLQLITPETYSVNRNIEISRITRSLKLLSMELDIPIISLSQLNRSLEKREDKRPVLSDLRDSGSIEQDADLIIFIYREEIYNRYTKNKNMGEIIIAKHRNGDIGNLKLKFVGKFAKFENLTIAGKKNKYN